MAAEIVLAGGKGLISASANALPASLVEVVDAALSGDKEKATNLQEQSLPKIQSLFLETNPAPVKTALMLKGIIQTDRVRLPLVSVSDTTRETLKKLFS